MITGCITMNRKWSTEQQALFLRKTGELLSRGYSLSEAIESLAYYFPAHKKIMIGQCLVQLREGFPLHQILTDLDFNKSLVGYVYFAEQHGGLAEAFTEGSAIMLKRSQSTERMMKMFYYPGILMVITAILFYFVDRILLPQIYFPFSVNGAKTKCIHPCHLPLWRPDALFSLCSSFPLFSFYFSIM